MSAVKRVLRALNLTKIAAVDAPCQEPALAEILKRAPEYEALLKAKYNADQRKEMAANGEAMSDGSYPIKDAEDLNNAIHAVGHGRNNSHTAIRAHIKRRAKALSLTDKIPEDWTDGEKLSKGLYDALRKGGILIAQSDEDEGAETFEQALGDQQMTQAFWQAYCQATSALEGSLMSILKDETVADKKPLITQSLQQFADHIEQVLPDSLGKSLAAPIRGVIAGDPGALSLNKGDPMSDAVKKALGLEASATEADVLKAIADNAEAVAKAKKTPPAYDGDADDEDMEKALKSGDAFKTPEGVVITKKAVGEGVFTVLKSQNDQIAKQAADLAKARDRELEADFAKRATDAGQDAAFGSTLRKAYGGDATAQVEVEKRIKALQEQVSAGDLFKNFGHNQPAEGSAAAEFAAKMAEVKKSAPHLTDQQAYSRVYTDRANAPLVKRMKEEAAEA